MTDYDTWRIVLGYDGPPISLNSRMKWQQSSRINRDLRAEARYRSARIPRLAHADVTLDWVVVDKRRRDEDNMFATLKPLADGLVDAGIVPDDTPEYMAKRCRIRYVPRSEGGFPHLELIVVGRPLVIV